MHVADLAVPATAYSAVCAAVWLACNRTDGLLTAAGKNTISNWLRSARSSDQDGVGKLFAILFTTFFGNPTDHFGMFIARAMLFSSVWVFMLFSLFYTNIPPPYFFTVYSPFS
jgi:hypothetical protein